MGPTSAYMCRLQLHVVVARRPGIATGFQGGSVSTFPDCQGGFIVTLPTARCERQVWEASNLGAKKIQILPIISKTFYNICSEDYTFSSSGAA